MKFGAAVTGAVALGAPPNDVRADDDAPMTFGIGQLQQANVALPPLAVIALNRLAWGPKPDDPFTGIGAFNTLGADDVSRLTAWVDQQLDATFLSAQDDSDARLAAAASSLPSLPQALSQLWTNYYRAQSVDRTKPVKDVRVATLIRALFSRRQLYEVMVDFWHNHFSIYAWDFSYASSTWASYDRDVIRPNTLGNFRTMLEAVAKSTAMLYYLDNFINQDGGPNENYARELIELHTLGAENYFGTMRQQDVPGYPAAPTGYVDGDVYEATRAFTGWRVKDGTNGLPSSDNDGTFYYHPTWHDRFQKRILGFEIDPDQLDEFDGKKVLDLLRDHMGTARFICRKLIRRLITDDPPQQLVDDAATRFFNLRNDPEQIKKVVRFIICQSDAPNPALAAAAFATTWGQKVKRPHEALFGALRAVRAEVKVDAAFNGINSFWNAYDQMGQPMFGRRPPDGYPDVRDAWTNTTSLLYRWKTINAVMENSYFSPSNDAGIQVDNTALVNTMGGANTPNAIADFWITRLLGRAMDDAAHRAEVVKMMQGWDTGSSSTSVKPIYTPDQAMAQTDINNRLRRMIAVILMSPECQWR
jgi:uncharacterized protein (DUF1800 family)